VVSIPGDRLVLREFELADEQALHAIVSDPAVTAHTLWEPNSPSDTRAFLAAAVAQAETPGARPGYHLAAVEADTGKLIGSVTLDVENSEHARGLVSFVFAPECWGQGYASEALRLILAFGLEKLRLHRIVAHCDPEYPPCSRVMEKAGMHREGLLREYKWIRGRWRDCLLFARVADR
jgi:ribosomal-protein-alanine N-acetyltransferase